MIQISNSEVNLAVCLSGYCQYYLHGEGCQNLSCITKKRITNRCSRDLSNLRLRLHFLFVLIMHISEIVIDLNNRVSAQLFDDIVFRFDDFLMI